MSRTKGHSRSAITGSGGRGWDARFEPARGCPAPAFWLASAGRRLPVAWWRPLPEWRGRVLPGQAPQRRGQDVTEGGAEDDPFELAVQAPPSVDRGQVGSGDLPGGPGAGVGQGEQVGPGPGRTGAARTPVSSSRAGVSGLTRQPRPRMSSPAWHAGLPGRVAGGVPVPAGRGILRLAERVVQAGSRRSAGGEQVADGRWTARPPRPGRGSAAAAAGVTRRTAPGRGWSARRAVAVPRGGST